MGRLSKHQWNRESTGRARRVTPQQARPATSAIRARAVCRSRRERFARRGAARGPVETRLVRMYTPRTQAMVRMVAPARVAYDRSNRHE